MRSETILLRKSPGNHFCASFNKHKIIVEFSLELIFNGVEFGMHTGGHFYDYNDSSSLGGVSRKYRQRQRMVPFCNLVEEEEAFEFFIYGSEDIDDETERALDNFASSELFLPSRPEGISALGFSLTGHMDKLFGASQFTLVLEVHNPEVLFPIESDAGNVGASCGGAHKSLEIQELTLSSGYVELEKGMSL